MCSLRAGRYCLTAALALCAAPLLRAQAAPAPTEAELAAAIQRLPPDLVRQLAALGRPWQASGDLSCSAGYDSNVFLSASDPTGAGVVRGDADVLLVRMPAGPWSGFASLNGDSETFLGRPGLPDEQEWFAALEARWDPGARLRLAAGLTGFDEDQVFDLTASTAQHLIARLKATGGEAKTHARLRLGRGFWTEAAAASQRDHFRGFDESFDGRTASVRLGWSGPAGTELSAGYGADRRDFFTRERYTTAGRALAGTQLRFFQRQGDVKAGVTAEWLGRWKLEGSFAAAANRDNGSGFFDYDQKSAAAGLSWERGRWRVAATLGAQRYVFRVQTVGIGLAPPPLLIEDYDEKLRAERRIAPRCKVFVEDRWERNRSNSAVYGYRVNTALVGTGVEF